MPRILVISHVPTHPVNSGNRARVNSLLTALQSAGHEVCLFLIDFGNGDNNRMIETWDRFWSVPYNFPKSSLKRRILGFIFRKFKINKYIPYGIDDWYNDCLNEQLLTLKNNNKAFDVVLVEYVFFSKALTNYPEALKIIDTHDIFGNRHKVFLEHGKQPSWFYTTLGEEKKGVNRADAILAIQKAESKYFSSLSPGKDVLTVGHITKIVFPDPAKPFFNRLLFIGSDNDVNFHALSYFFDCVWPRVREMLPTVQLDVVGKICSRFTLMPEGCNMIGPVNDLEACYDGADIVINPVQFGTGLKIKNIEALGYGMPLVTTEVGADGMENGAGRAFKVANNEEQFTLEICALLNNNNERKNLSSAALEFAQNYNNEASRPLLNFINKKLS